ncbi:unnamed protein product [Blepharisma stoltei]|uniref:Afadin-and alpha-actinin-binding protein n=1 Tax=Blepharisma stoltei TaxID=1481888 RepID=A0AAU9IX69_9CILI|nr:unnamed protein product [Blepharisma stoltei]
MSYHRNPLENYLGSDNRLDFNQFGNLPEEPPEQPSQSLTNSIKHITSTLVTQGLPPPGNLFSTDFQEVSKTVNSIYALMQSRQRDAAFRSDLIDKNRSLENEKSKLAQNNERLNTEKSNLESELAKLKNQIKTMTIKNKEEKDKILLERDELKRENNKLTHKETQSQHELKKKDAAYAKLQEQLRKSLGEKDLPIRNQVELTSPLHTNGVSLFARNGDSEFSYLISRGYEENQNALLAENQELRSAFLLLQNELQDMMKQRREAFHKRYAEELGDLCPDFAEFQQKPVKPEVMNLPFQGISENVIKAFQENMRVFREFMDKADEAALNVDGEGDEELQKIKCIADLKELLKNYRILLKNQENIMQNAILGSRSRAPDNIGYTASRLKVAADTEIEKANRFLQEEFSKLELKQQEIEEQRHLVSDTAHRMDEEKFMITKQREQLMEERNRWEQALQSACKLNSELVDE